MATAQQLAKWWRVVTHGVELPDITTGISSVSGLVEGDLVGAEGLEALQGTGYHRGTFLSCKPKILVL